MIHFRQHLHRRSTLWLSPSLNEEVEHLTQEPAFDSIQMRAARMAWQHRCMSWKQFGATMQ
ncbi:hypothetical protein [Thiocapsa sp.]|uniref:hypothetical protein n=1 Tax=Thiocapsa sp. TaxID=2024551 RepID=UPI0025FF3FA1|nr:hypothetical protein [Thiocapsa sp.]